MTIQELSQGPPGSATAPAGGAKLEAQVPDLAGTPGDSERPPAGAVARTPAETAPPDLADRFLVAATGDLLLALPLDRIRELRAAPVLAPLPLVPPWIRGLTHLRGEILAVLDLLPFLGREALARRPSNRLLVLGPPAGSSAAGEALAGLLVAEVRGVVPAAPAAGAPATAALASFSTATVDHPTGRAAVLDVDRLLAALAAPAAFRASGARGTSGAGARPALFPPF